MPLAVGVFQIKFLRGYKNIIFVPIKNWKFENGEIWHFRVKNCHENLASATLFFYHTVEALGVVG